VWVMEILKRSVDDRGRIVLPIKGKKEVFVVKWNDIIIIAPSKNQAEEVVKQLENLRKKKMLEVINEWFDMIEESGLDKLTARDLDKILARSLLRDIK